MVLDNEAILEKAELMLLEAKGPKLGLLNTILTLNPFGKLSKIVKSYKDAANLRLEALKMEYEKDDKFEELFKNFLAKLETAEADKLRDEYKKGIESQLKNELQIVNSLKSAQGKESVNYEDLVNPMSIKGNKWSDSFPSEFLEQPNIKDLDKNYDVQIDIKRKQADVLIKEANRLAELVSEKQQKRARDIINILEIWIDTVTLEEEIQLAEGQFSEAAKNRLRYTEQLLKQRIDTFRGKLTTQTSKELKNFAGNDVEYLDQFANNLPFTSAKNLLQKSAVWLNLLLVETAPQGFIEYNVIARCFLKENGDIAIKIIKVKSTSNASKFEEGDILYWPKDLVSIGTDAKAVYNKKLKIIKSKDVDDFDWEENSLKTASNFDAYKVTIKDLQVAISDSEDNYEKYDISKVKNNIDNPRKYIETLLNSEWEFVQGANDKLRLMYSYPFIKNSNLEGSKLIVYFSKLGAGHPPFVIININNFIFEEGKVLADIAFVAKTSDLPELAKLSNNKVDIFNFADQYDNLNKIFKIKKDQSERVSDIDVVIQQDNFKKWATNIINEYIELKKELSKTTKQRPTKTFEDKLLSVKASLNENTPLNLQILEKMGISKDYLKFIVKYFDEGSKVPTQSIDIEDIPADTLKESNMFDNYQNFIND